MHITPNDEFAKARNKVRDKQHKQVNYYKDKGDIDGFKNWIEETKFTTRRLKEKWKQYQDSTK